MDPIQYQNQLFSLLAQHRAINDILLSQNIPFTTSLINETNLQASLSLPTQINEPWDSSAFQTSFQYSSLPLIEQQKLQQTSLSIDANSYQLNYVNPLYSPSSYQIAQNSQYLNFNEMKEKMLLNGLQDWYLQVRQPQNSGQLQGISQSCMAPQFSQNLSKCSQMEPIRRKASTTRNAMQDSIHSSIGINNHLKSIY